MRIADIIRHISNLFEKKRKNPIKLDNDSNLESNLKFLKVGDKSTPIQISEDTINVEGNLKVNGSAVQTGTDAGATQLNELSDVTYSSGDLAVSLLDKIAVEADLTLDVVGDIELNADGGDINFKDDTASLVNINNTNTKFYNPSSADSYCQLTVTNRGNTTLSTEDSTDNNAGHITIAPEGAFKIEGAVGGIYIKEQIGASATLDSYGSLRVEGTNPTRLYFTNDDGDDIQITDGSGLKTRDNPHVFEFGGRARNQYNNWYYAAHTTYGHNYYYFFYSTGTTVIPSSWVDSIPPAFLVPRDGTITGYTIIGNNSTTDTWEWICMKGAQPTFGSAGNWSMSQIGSTQSAGGTASILYKWEQTGLSVAVSKNDMLAFYHRRTTDNDASYAYCEFSAYITME